MLYILSKNCAMHVSTRSDGRGSTGRGVDEWGDVSAPLPPRRLLPTLLSSVFLSSEMTFARLPLGPFFCGGLSKAQVRLAWRQFWHGFWPLHRTCGYDQHQGKPYPRDWMLTLRRWQASHARLLAPVGLDMLVHQERKGREQSSGKPLTSFQ